MSREYVDAIYYQYHANPEKLKKFIDFNQDYWKKHKPVGVLKRSKSFWHKLANPDIKP